MKKLFPSPVKACFSSCSLCVDSNVLYSVYQNLPACQLLAKRLSVCGHHKQSAIRSHTEQVCNTAVSNAAISKGGSASNDLDLHISESIYIHEGKPILNDKESDLIYK